jgi:LmbE family N-acetylglucosaminyl deacetylase
VDNLITTLSKYRGKTLLLVFPHPDDEAYVAGGLLQLAQRLSIKTKLICLTKGGVGKKVQEAELRRACEILGVDELSLWNFTELKLREEKSEWLKRLAGEIKTSNAQIIVTFDHSGITGHPDHIVVSREVLALIKKMQPKPLLYWRVPDMQEYKYFKDNNAMLFAENATHALSYGLAESLNKISAIFAHKSKMKSFLYRLQILEWFLFDHKELYYKVDFKRDYPYKFVFYKEA